jgi:hydrogenase 3 maturation protease
MVEKKTLPSSWKKRVTQALALNSGPEPVKRVAILGIGNPLNGDDAVGVVIADQLITILSALTPTGSMQFKAINTGPVPENFTGALRKYAPHFVLMIDAAQMGKTEGFIRWIALDEIAGFSASTHGLPLALLASYLVDQLACQVALIGIQPGSSPTGNYDELAPLSPTVNRAARKITQFLQRLFVENNLTQV